MIKLSTLSLSLSLKKNLRIKFVKCIFIYLNNLIITYFHDLNEMQHSFKLCFMKSSKSFLNLSLRILDDARIKTKKKKILKKELNILMKISLVIDDNEALSLFSPV